VVIRDFKHKLDMLDGTTNGILALYEPVSREKNLFALALALALAGVWRLDYVALGILTCHA
jgi:Mlc titration factor MtfA (ptsG expression regulator)